MFFYVSDMFGSDSLLGLLSVVLGVVDEVEDGLDAGGLQPGVDSGSDRRVPGLKLFPERRRHLRR